MSSQKTSSTKFSLLSPVSRKESKLSRAEELMRLPSPPWPKARTTEEWAENRAWALFREVVRGNMLMEEALEMTTRVYRQLQSDPMPDPQRERLRRLLTSKGSTF